MTYLIDLPVATPEMEPEVTRSREFINQVLVNDDLWDRLLCAL